MEYFEGSTLENLIFCAKNKVLTIKDKICIIDKICRAIAFLHKRKTPIIHRDIKCANILVNDSLDIRIIDLGLSKYNETKEAYTISISTKNFPKGTKNYLPPEILLREDNPYISTATDI